jgi:hypothetical protein
VDGDHLLLDPDASYAEVQRLSQETGEPLALGRDTLHRRLHERQLLAATDPARRRLVVRRVTEGNRRSVICFFAARVLGLDTDGPLGPSGLIGENPQENEPDSGAHYDVAPSDGPIPEAHSGPGTGNGPTANGHFPGKNGVAWPPGPKGPSATAHDAPPAETEIVEEEGSIE